MLAAVVNAATVAASVALWRVALARASGTPTRSPTRQEVALTASTAAVNAVALLPAWWLWRRGTLTLADPSPLAAVAGFAYLVAVVETAMYLLHRLFHTDLLYRWFHRVHHVDDRRMHPLALFVMHPAEPLGFALVVGLAIVAVPVPLAAIVAFFGLNLAMGTLAHLPAPALDGDRWSDRWLGGAVLHQGHHRTPEGDFGFFTQVWDRVLGTRSGGSPAAGPR